MKDLNKMTKAELIDHIKTRECHQVPTLMSGMTFGLMAFVERVVQYLLNIRANGSKAWETARTFYELDVDADNNVVVTFKNHSISTEDFKKKRQSERDLSTAIKLSKSLEGTNNSADSAGVSGLLEPMTTRPRIILFEY